tara:strand:+ start:713 stop:946 length:234 start_codon:yes stop_codon:yes gene_type:complete
MSGELKLIATMIHHIIKTTINHLFKIGVEIVRDYLTYHHIFRDIIFKNYHGENFILANNSTPQGHSANRTDLIRISS